MKPAAGLSGVELMRAALGLRRRGQFADSLSLLQRAAERSPGEAAIWLNLGVACLDLGRPAEAEAGFRRALSLEPGRPEAWNILGHAVLVQGRCSEAALALRRAIELRPSYAAAHDNLGRVLKAQGRSEEALAEHRAACAAENRPTTHSNLLYTLNFVPGMEPERVAAEHRNWARLHASAPPRSHAGHDFTPDRPLRIGFVSPDLVRHSVTYFLEPVLEALDRGKVRVACYSDAPATDQVTERLRRKADLWRDSSRMTDDALEECIVRDRIDVLVDLAGHTARNRLILFGRKPAPLLVTWLGYPNSTGLASIDFRLTDEICDPPGMTERWHSETLFRLPVALSCYRPPIESPPVGALPAETTGRITFGCFNNLAKVNPRTLRLWAGILRKLPGSCLFLRSRGLADAATAERLRLDLSAQGIAGDRVVLNGEELSVPAHLALYDRVDIAFDTFPYNGTTTTCEALWMGAPVVTLAGRTHASRVGASLLRHVGLEEAVAETEESYSAAAVGLASELPKLMKLRGELRPRMRASALCDHDGFCRRFEDALREMWRDRCRRG